MQSTIQATIDQIHASYDGTLPEDHQLICYIVKRNTVELDQAEAIRQIVCKYFQVEVRDLYVPNKRAEITIVRKFIAYMLQKFTTLTLKAMALFSGLTNHCSVIRNLERLSGWMESDESLRRKATDLETLIIQTKNSKPCTQ